NSLPSTRRKTIPGARRRTSLCADGLGKAIRRAAGRAHLVGQMPRPLVAVAPGSAAGEGGEERREVEPGVGRDAHGGGLLVGGERLQACELAVEPREVG